VATLNLVERLGSGSAVLVSVAITARVLPSLLMFPAAGVVADRRVSTDQLLLKLVVGSNKSAVAKRGGPWLMCMAGRLGEVQIACVLQVQPGGGADCNQPGVSSDGAVLSASADAKHTLVSPLCIGLVQEHSTARSLVRLCATMM
jgi:hypothetical protein